MNQPCRLCFTAQLHIESSYRVSLLSLDSDASDDEFDNDWIDMDPCSDSVNDFPKDIHDFMEGTRAHQPFIELYPKASENHGQGQMFMDIFDADEFFLECQQNLYYPFSSKQNGSLHCGLPIQV